MSILMLKNRAKGQISNLTIGVIILIMTMISSNLNWNSGYWKNIVKTDGKGYYVYLPAIFIYKDLNLGFFDSIYLKKYYNKDNYFDFRVKCNGQIITKYFSGTALLQLPFFMIAHGISRSFGYDNDGFSAPYPVLISIAALAYLLLGLVFLKKLLLLYKVRQWFIALVIFSITFGTNLCYYTVNEPGMSHIYSFALISAFLYYGKKYFNNPAPGILFILFILYGLIILVRPVNGLIILSLPFISGSLTRLNEGLSNALKYRLSFLAGFFSFLLVISIQLVIYKISTGRFVIYPYPDEGFLFMSPHIIDILFSYKKGLFLYTPLLFISLWGGNYLWKHNRFEFFSIFSFLLLLTYVLSSWNNWWYGGSFSSRVYAEYLPFFAILLGVAIENMGKSIYRKIYVSFIILLVIVCQIQIYQYRYYHIHWENMTREKYWDEFMRIDRLID